MCDSRKLRVFWALTLALLTLSQVLHAAEHLEVFSRVADCQQNHDHHSQNDPVSPSNDCGASCLGCDHSHSVAILDCHTLPLVQTVVSNAAVSPFFEPDAPARKIDYPPQLS